MAESIPIHQMSDQELGAAIAEFTAIAPADRGELIQSTLARLRVEAKRRATPKGDRCYCIAFDTRPQHLRDWHHEAPCRRFWRRVVFRKRKEGHAMFHSDGGHS